MSHPAWPRRRPGGGGCCLGDPDEDGFEEGIRDVYEVGEKCYDVAGESPEEAQGEDRARERHGDEVGEWADRRNLLEACRDNRSGGDLSGQGDGQEVREHLRRLLERAQDGALYERLQGLPEEQDVEDGGDGELEPEL